MGIREVVDEAKKKRGPLAKIMEERRAEAQTEYEETKIRRLVEEEKARIREVQRTGKAMQPGLATSFTSHIFQLAQVDPNKAKAFLEGLDEESMKKIAYLMALENDRAGAFLQLAKSSGTNVKDLIEISKLMRSNGSVDLKGIAEIFKAGVEAAKANKPEGPGSYQEGYKYIHETFVKPFTEALRASEKETFDARLKLIEDKIPPPLPAQIAHIKQTATSLGMGESGKKGEIDLKIEEMRQSHDLDMSSLRWEQQKFMLQQEAERDKWGAIQQMLSPITAMAAPEVRSALRSAGREVGKRLQGSSSPSAPPSKTPLASFTCPKCEAELTVPIPPNAPEEIPIKCPKCGEVTPAKLRRGEEAPPPPEEKPKGRLSYKMG